MINRLTLLIFAVSVTTIPLSAQTITQQTIAGLQFRTIGPATMSGRIVDLAVVEANPTTFYIASATGGVWKTVNNGVTFEPVFEDEGTHSVGDIAVSQLDTNIVWVGTGERANRQSSSWGDGVYKSTDGGKTWKNTGLRDSHHIGRIAIHPRDPNVVFVAAMGHLWGPNEERGIYKTADGGETWQRVLHVDTLTGGVDVAIDHSDPSIVYAATYQRMRKPFGFDGGGPGSALWKSTDGGTAWKKITGGLPSGAKGRIGISIYRKDPRIVYVSVEQGYRYSASTQYTERAAGVYRSEDRGETWQHMSDWNPRPMYASQPLVDPNDDQRIYMENAFSYSDDGGKTFTRVRQSLHGDDRILWVNPRDSRHLIKGDDGGLGISYDRAKTWLYITSLPLSQFYRVSVDNATPYWVYGGLQDNGTWMGPSATHITAGIRFEDWVRLGGGDGFQVLPDTVDNRTVYVESQYLGLTRVDLVTRERKDIRPGDPRGHIAARKNWDAWGPGTPEPELGNAMAPANWDGPYIISPHDHNTLYAGTNQLWKSTDRGDTWVSLGDLTTGINRRELQIMGRRAQDSTPSLDDGIPYYPTLTAVAESPLERGVLYVGTDDGNLQVSRDDGMTWTNVSRRVPSAPPSPWINGLEPSRFDAATVYLTIDNHRNDDYGNYVYRSTDYGRTWTSIAGDLPADRATRTLREDLRNPNVLYLGTELGLFYTYDGGRHWVELRGNMPTAAFNDLVIHPRDNDLVLGTHGRGIWILDNINALQELEPRVTAEPGHLFTLEPAYQIRYARETGHTGDMIFRGDNPPAGAIIDYHLQSPLPKEQLSIVVLDGSAREVNRVEPDTAAGLNRVIWNLREADLVVPDEDDDDEPGFGPPRRIRGPWVLPGMYTVRLTVDGAVKQHAIEVRNDPRIDVSRAELVAWHGTMKELGEMIRPFAPMVDSVTDVKARLDSLPDDQQERHRQTLQLADSVMPMLNELRSRLVRLYSDMDDWTGQPTSDQRAQLTYYKEWIARLEPGARTVMATEF
jgi:photosystem II stability/assembly factor-like uncharacterized protein